MSQPVRSLREGCAAILCNLASTVGSEKEMIKAGIVSRLLVTARVTSGEVATKIVCTKALINVLYDENMHQVMVKDGILWGLSSLANVSEEVCP